MAACVVNAKNTDSNINCNLSSFLQRPDCRWSFKHLVLAFYNAPQFRFSSDASTNFIDVPIKYSQDVVREKFLQKSPGYFLSSFNRSKQVSIIDF